MLLSSELRVVRALHVVATRIGREDGGMSVITFVFRVFLVGVPFLWFILDTEVQLRFQSHLFILTLALPSSAASRTQEIEIVKTETSRLNLCDHGSCLFLLLESYFSCVHNPNKPSTVMENLHIAEDECCFDVNCTCPRLFHYFALSEAKHCSSRNSGMSLPLSSKQLCCRHTPPKIYFSNKGPLTCLQLRVTISRKIF